MEGTDAQQAVFERVSPQEVDEKRERADRAEAERDAEKERADKAEAMVRELKAKLDAMSIK